MLETEKKSSMDKLADNEIDFNMVASVIKARWIWVILAGFIGLLFAAVVALHTPPKYTVNALIQVKAQNSTQSLLGKMGALASDLSSQASPADIQRALLHSRYILGTVVRDLNLNVTIQPHYFPIFGRHLASEVDRASLMPAKFGLRSYAWGNDRVQLTTLHVPSSLYGKKLTLVKESAQTYYLLNQVGHRLVSGVFGKRAWSQDHAIQINIKHMQARVGEPFAIVVSSMADTIQALSQNLTISDAGEAQNASNTGVLQVSLVGTDPQMLPIILNRIINVGAEKNIAQSARDAAQSLIFINAQIPKMKLQLNQAENLLNHYQSSHGIVNIDAEAKMLLTQLGAQEQSLEAAQLEKTSMLQSYTKEHPVILALNDKIQAIQSQINTTKSKIQNMPTTDQVALSLMRDVKIKEGVYAGLLEKSEQLAVLKAGTVGDISILNLSTEPVLIPAHKASKLLGGLVFGMILAIVILLARRMLLQVCLSPDEVEKHIHVSVQAILPYCRKIFHKHNPKASDALVAREFHDEPIVEAIRGLRTSLQLSLALNQKKVITVLGATPGIGKTLLSTNLGLVFSDSSKKVLLIDTDMRRGQAKNVFNITSKKGLSDYLKGTAALEAVIHKVDDHLDVISSGTYTTKSNDLLLKPDLEKLLEVLKNQYDYIILDTPPILPVSDALLVAKHADANLFLVGLGKNKPDEIKAAYNRFRSNNIDILFGVCNYCSKVAIKDATGQYGYYNYDYKY